MRRAWAVAAAVGLIGLGLAGGRPAPAAAGPGGQATTSLELVDQTAWVEVGGSLDLTVSVTGAPAEATAQVRVHEQLPSRQAFTDSLTGEVGGAEAVFDPQPVVLDAAGNMRLAYPVGQGGAGLGRDDHGVYPVTVTVADAAGQILDQLITYLVLQPDPVYASAFPPLAVAVILDVAASPGLQPDGTVALGPDELAAIDTRVGILDEVGGLPLTVAPMPETLDALAGGGASTLRTLNGVTRALRGRPLVARPYVDLDLGALAAAGMLNQVPPEADAGAQTIRSRLGVDPTGGIWLAGSSGTAATARALRELGVPRAVVSSGSLDDVPDGIEPSEGVTGPVALAEDGPLAVVADDALADRLLGQEGALEVQRFVAELAMIWALEPSHSRSVVVEVPGEPALDPSVVSRALGRLGEPQSMVQLAPLDQAFAVPPAGDDGAPAVVDLAAGTEDESSAALGAIADDLLQAQADLNGLAGMLDDSGLVRQLQRSLWIAPGSDTLDAERRAYVDRVRQIGGGLAGAINAPETFRITLTAREGTIPLSIENTSDQIVSVRVELASNQMEFPEGPTLDLDVPPGGTRVDLDVRLRASGAFPLQVTITSPDGSIVLDRTTFTIRSTAVSGVGLVLSIGAGLFLLIWWARHWRTTRRSSRLVHEPPPRHAVHGDRHHAVPARRP